MLHTLNGPPAEVRLAADPAWLSVAEVAGTLRVSERVVLGAIHRGQLPGRRIGKEYRVPAAAVAAPAVNQEGEETC